MDRPTAAIRISGTFVFLLIYIMGFTQKTDKVFLKNGDVVTGDIKSLKLAKLNFDMNGPGIISIKWEEIVRITSDKTFQVTLQNGQVLVTKLDTLFEAQHVNLQNIVEIVQIKNKFLERLDGNVNVGFNYAKSNDITQFNFSSSITYRKPKLEINLKLTSFLSRSSSDTTDSKKQDATIGVLKTLNRRFFLLSNLGWEQNTQLGLDNRYLLSGTTGKMIFNDNHRRLLTGIGIAYSEEKFNESSGYSGSIEALGILQFKRFRYSSPKVSMNAQYTVYPSLSDWGRVRMNFQVDTNIEIFKNFFAGFTFYDNFDSRPSSDAASKNDYGIAFTISYEFGK